MSASAPGGYVIHEGLFRSPDLLTYPQMQAYFRDVYGYHLELYPLDKNGDPDYDTEGAAVSPARALGQSFNIAPTVALDGRVGDDVDGEQVQNLMSGVDPVLRGINERSNPAAYDTRPIGNNPHPDDTRAVNYEEQVQGGGDGDSVVVEDDDPELKGDDPGDSDLPKSYDEMTVEELKAELRDRKLPVSGNQPELVERLREDDRSKGSGD